MKDDIEHKIEYIEDKIIVTCNGFTCTMHNSKDDERNKESINDFLDMQKSERFYNSESFIDEFNKHLETAILATRGGNSAAGTISDALLSLYNGNHYKANLSGWYNLDCENKAALLFILEHQTANHVQAIDSYLPQYQDDFERMKRETKADD